MTALSTMALMGGAALLGGSLAIRGVRRSCYGDIEKDWLHQELEIDSIHDDGFTVELKNSTLFRVFRIGGISYDALVDTEQESLQTKRNAILHVLAESGIKARLFGIKRICDVSYDATWPSSVLERIGKREQSLYKNSFDISWYAVIQHKSYSALHEATDRLVSLGGVYDFNLVHAAKENCPLTGFINYLVSGDLRHDLPCVSHNIAANIPASNMTYDTNGLIRTHTPTEQFIRMVAVRAWPDVIGGVLIKDIMSLPCDVEIAQCLFPQNKQRMQVTWSNKIRELTNFSIFIGTSAATAYTNALDYLGGDENSLFSTQLTVMLRASSLEALEEHLRALSKVLGKHNINFTTEGKATPILWFNRIPGRESLLRPLKIFSTNVAALWSFHYAPTGMRSNPWATTPVRLFGTGTGQSYAFQFHVSDRPQSRGHYLVFAPTGGGKSTLLLHLLGGLTKYEGVRSYIFDSKEGTRFMVEAFGGMYQSFDKISLNPLDCEDTRENHHHINLIMRAMLGEHGNDEGTDDMVQLLLRQVFTVAPPERTFNAVYNHAFSRHTVLKKAFAKWVIDDRGNKGLYGDIFNAPHDSLGNTLNAAPIIGINMNEALSDPVLGPPVVIHIATAISKMAARNARGFNIFIDEAAKLLENDGFKAVSLEMFREYRKLNGCVGMAFQDPAALHRSGVAEAIIENTATLVFLPNTQATRSAYAPFNLNDEHMNFITGGQEGRKALIVKRDGSTGFDESVIIDVDLASYGDEVLRYYRSGTDAVKDLQGLQEQHGKNWQEYLT